MKTHLILILVWTATETCAQHVTQSHKGSLVPPILEVKCNFIDDNENGILETGESGSLVVNISNRGGRADNVVVRLEPLQAVTALLFDTVVVIKEIPAGEAREEKLVLRAYDGVSTQDALFNVEIRDLSRLNNASYPVSVPLRSLSEQKLTLSKYELHYVMGGPAVEKVLLGGEMYVKLEIHNTGERVAKGVVLHIAFDTLACELDLGDKFVLGDLPSQQSRSIYFPFLTKTLVKSDSLRFVARFVDQQIKSVSQFPFAFPIRPAKRSQTSDAYRSR